MSIDFSVARYWLARVFGRSVSELRQMAHRTWQHAPAGVLTQRPPLFVPGELERVIDISARSTFEIERARLFATESEYPATEIFELRPATLLSGQIYSSGGRSSLRSTRLSLRKIWPRRVSNEPAGFLGSSDQSWRNFSYWLTDQLATEWLGNNLGYPLFTVERRFQHSDAYREKLPWHARELSEGRFDRLLLARDSGQNPSRVARLHALREKIRGHWGVIPSNNMVYIKQGRTAPPLRLLNEQEIERFVSDQGGSVIQTEEMSVQEIAAKLQSTQLVIGIEGSPLSHAIMLASSNSTLLVIQPPCRFHNLLKTYTDAVGMRYGFAVAENDVMGFRLPADRLARLIDLACAVDTPLDSVQPGRSEASPSVKQSSLSRR